MQQLPRIVPLVDRVREVDALVALEADQPRAQHLGHDLGRLCLADACLTLDEEGLLQLEREKDGRRQGAVTDVAAFAQTLLDVLDRRGCAHADKGYEVVGPSTRIVRTNRPAVRSKRRIVRTIREGGPARSAGPRATSRLVTRPALAGLPAWSARGRGASCIPGSHAGRRLGQARPMHVRPPLPAWRPS